MNSNPTPRGDRALIKVRDRGQVTLLPEARTALKVESGDYLEAQVVEGGVLLTPVSVVKRSPGWETLLAALDAMRAQGDPATLEEQERAVAQLIEAYRKEKRGPASV